MDKKYIAVPGRLESVATDGQIAGASQVYDDDRQKSQAAINDEFESGQAYLDNKISALQKEDVVPVDTLPAVADADPKKIYRVVGTDSYTDYMLNAAGDDFKRLATHSFPGIDDEPTAGSNNLVKSGGVSKWIERFVLVGKGSEAVRNDIYGLMKGRTYRISLSPWTYSNSEQISTSAEVLGIYAVRGATVTTITTLTISKQAEKRNIYDVRYNDDYDSLRINIRANVSDRIFVNVADVTNEKDIAGEGFRYKRFGKDYFNENGYFNNNTGKPAGFTDGVSIYSDNYIAVNPDDAYDVENASGYLVGFACYNLEKEYVSTYWFSSRAKIIVPSGCYYIRLMIRNNNGLTVNTMSGWIGLRFDDGNSERISSLESLVVDGASIKSGGENGKYISNTGKINTSSGGTTNYIVIPNKYFKKIVANVGRGDNIPAIAFFSDLPIGESTFISSIERTTTNDVYTVDDISDSYKYIAFNTPAAYSDSLKIECYPNLSDIAEDIQLNKENISQTTQALNELSEAVESEKESVDDIFEIIYGVTPVILHLDGIRGSGEIVGRYIHYNTYKPTVASDVIITKPIYLKAGDTVSVSSSGSGMCIFAKSPNSTINIGTVFTPISTGNNYEGTIAEDGWYCFSGRINRTDGTNLVLEVHSTSQGKSIEEKIDEKVDKSEIASLGGSNGLSFGIKQIKSEIPNYWFGTIESTNPLYDKLSYNTYLENKIDSVPEGKHFIFITDVHYSGQAHCRSASILDYVRRRLGIKTIIHGGDVENENADMSLAAKQWLDFNDDFVLRIGGDFKQVCGDHDHNGRYASSDPQLNQAFPYAFVQRVLNGYNINELHYDTLYDERIATYGWTDTEMKEYDAWKKMHYYYDDNTIKTRFIVLHTGWTGDVGLAVDKIGSNALNEQQSTYLQMDFLYHSLMTTPNGYNVVICGHNVIGNKSYNVDDATQYNLSEPVWKGSWQQIAKMLRAFRGRTVSPAITYRDWSSSGTLSKTYNFTDAPTINVSFCIGGDVHWDILAKSQTASETLTNVVNESHIDKEDDILHVVTMTDGTDRMYKSYPDGELISPQRIEGTTDEQAFDIVTITDNAIYFTRIGAGDDRIVYLD